MGKSRPEENRGKAGNKENIKVLHITVHKTRPGSYEKEQSREQEHIQTKNISAEIKIQ